MSGWPLPQLALCWTRAFPKWESGLAFGQPPCKSMRVISRRPLNELAQRYPEAKAELAAWFHEAEAAHWANPARIKAQYGNASILKGSAGSCATSAAPCIAWWLK